ncbi:MAG: hypothetical protein NT027_05600 [Proteobacteria bacterium]|nr:hypothetical protein [Pseudomonadota bacterium]
MKNLLIKVLFGLFLPAQAFASIDLLKASGVVYHNSCSYYSNTEARVILELQRPISEGEQVEAHIGFGGFDWRRPANNRLQWIEIINLAPSSVGSDVTKFDFKKVVGSRLNPIHVDSVQVVFKVTKSNGDVEWIRGSDGQMSFFEITLTDSTAGLPCRQGQSELDVKEFKVIGVDRN